MKYQTKVFLKRSVVENAESITIVGYFKYSTIFVVCGRGTRSCYPGTYYNIAQLRYFKNVLDNRKIDLC
jgi:hypothetical protein